MKTHILQYRPFVARFSFVKKCYYLLILGLCILVTGSLPAFSQPGSAGHDPSARSAEVDEARPPQKARRSAADLSGRVGIAPQLQLPAPPPRPYLVPERRAPRLAPMPTLTAPSGGTLAASQTLVASPLAVTPLAVVPPAVASAKTLILYDSTNTWGWLGELYAQQTANLVSRFGTWKALPVASYTAGLMAAYTNVIYIGSTYDEPLSLAFLEDVRTTTLPIIWMYDNIWQVTAENPAFATTYGWMWSGYDLSAVTGVLYKGTLLDRDVLNQPSGIMGATLSDTTKAQVLATAPKADGTGSLPWAIKSGNLLYIGEIPFSYVGANDRYLAFADLLYTVYAPATATRHRALVRIEDVGPDADPAELKAVADVLYASRIPFSVAVYPLYKDPLGAYNGGKATSYALASRPAVISALKYMLARGGTLIMHGYTHQYAKQINPYSGASGDDFEFYLAHVDSANNVVYDGQVSGDSQSWAAGRLTSGRAAFLLAGLAAPTIFEVPHYAASVPDYKAILAQFAKRYDRGLYFGGILTGGTINYTRLNGQFFPYPVRDIYGAFVLPENLGNIEPLPYNNHPARLPADLLLTGQKNLVIRDGFASFYYHPYLGTADLVTVVNGLKAQGWTFVAAASITN